LSPAQPDGSQIHALLACFLKDCSTRGAAMSLSLIIFSGLPGTGKTTLSTLLARQLRLPLVRLDDVVGLLSPAMRAQAAPFWEEMMRLVLALAETHLDQGLSVVVDAVFMGPDRAPAQALAAQYQARFRPVHTIVSDEGLWQRRVEERRAQLPVEWDVATWERIQRQRLDFVPWEPGSALVVDGVEAVEANLARVLHFVEEG
jgi:predicted kinase